MSKRIDTRPRLFEGWRMSDAIHSKNLYTKDIVVRFVNIYPVDSDLAVGQLYLFYGQLGPDGWGETTIPSTLPSTIKTTYLQSSIIKKCPNSPPPPSSILKPSLSKKGPCYLTKLSRLFLTAKNSSKSIAPDPSLSMSLKYCSRTAGSDLSPRSSRTCFLMKDTSTELVFTVGLTRKVVFLCCSIKWSGIISRP